MAEGNNNSRLLFPLATAVGGLIVGVVGIISFLNAQFYTIREHEESRKTAEMLQFRNDDHFKHVDEQLHDLGERVSKLQGFVEAHTRH